MEMLQQNTLFSYFKQIKMSFFQKQTTGRQNSSCKRGWYKWDRGGYKERVEEGEYSENIMYICMYMEK
jgi:hypothetical protein